MKFETITHDPKQTSKTRKNAIPAYSLLKSPESHPFMVQREYMKALNATKIERLLAKPFIKAYSDHKDGINGMEISSNCCVTSSFRNDVIIRDLGTDEARVCDLQGAGKIESVCLKNKFNVFCAIKNKIFKINSKKSENKNYAENSNKNLEILCETNANINEVKYSSFSDKFYAATTKGVEIFTLGVKASTVLAPSTNFTSIHSEKFVATTAENEIKLFDERIKSEFFAKKIGNCNNEIKIFNNKFVTANDDGNGYLFDLRRLDDPFVLRGHTKGVVSCDIGENRVCLSSFDKTLRVYDLKTFKCEIFHSKRMAEVSKVRMSEDVVFSGSLDGSVRLWKLKNTDLLNRKMKNNLKFAEKLKKKFEGVEEIKRIDRHRFLPKELKGELKNQYEKYKAKERRMNRNHKK